MKLAIKNLSFGYDSNLVLTDINMEAHSGKITAIIGCNAAGKSTLLKCIARILEPEGRLLFDDRDIKKFGKKEITDYVSYLPQETPTHAALTVFEAILLGRLHWLKWRVSDEDLESVYQVLNDFGINEVALKYLSELSGGQKQIVSIAQSLIREPRILLLDEPTSNLDLQRQLEVLELIRDLTVDKDIVTVLALHDLNLAARYADEVVVLKEGEIYACGKTGSVLTSSMIESVYGVKARVDLLEDGVVRVTPVSSVKHSKSKTGEVKIND